MKRIDLHIHSVYSDGVNTIEEIISAAINNGFDIIGISDHSYTKFDESYCIKKVDLNKYFNEITSLKDKYADKITIYAGIEQDYYSENADIDFDYKIGSVHYLKVDNNYIPVDESKEILIDSTNKYFRGDIYSLIECYFDTVACVIEKTNANIVGHIDLIAKFNENGDLFDEKNERYIAAYIKACDKLLMSDCLFEINTGAISRGYRTAPYPSNSIYNYLKSKNAKFILSSDSHSADTLGYDFEKYNNLI